MKNQITKWLCLCIALPALLFTCSSNDEDTPDTVISELETVISGITPNFGPQTTIVTINGENFGTESADIKVFFNGKEGAVNAVTDTQIKAVVPRKAFTGEVTIEKNGATIIGPVFEYSTTYTVSTIAGSNVGGIMDGVGANAQFGYPFDIAADNIGNLYVADTYGHSIRKVTPQGVVSTIAGFGGQQGYIDGVGVNARFGFPIGIVVDEDGNLYVGDNDNKRIRKITPQGVVDTFAGNGNDNIVDGSGTNASFLAPTNLSIDATGKLYLLDGYNDIRKITQNAEVTTFHNETTFDVVGITTNIDGNIYISERIPNNVCYISRITPDGNTTVVAGGVMGFADGIGTDAQFNNPTDMTSDAFGNIYVVDSGNYKIRKIEPDGNVTTVAGSSSGHADGNGNTAQFFYPLGICIDTEGDLYVTDDSRIRKITIE